MRPHYEERAELQYAEPAPPPDPGLARKFDRIWALLREQLPAEALLDAGCGDGRYIAALGSMARRVVGVDISERILETARAAAQRAGVEPELVRANLESLPLEDDAFDVVLCTQVIEHVLDARAAVAELARVLRPGGTLILSTDNARDTVSRVLNAPRNAIVRAFGLRGWRGFVESPATPWEPAAFRRLVESAGLRVERLETFRFHLLWPLGPAWVQRLLNRIDERLPSHSVGDILVVVARRP